MPLETARIRSRLDLLYLVAREFNAGLDIDQVLHRVLSITVASVGAYDASLFLFDAEGRLENFFLVSDFEVQQQNRAAIESSNNQGLVSWVKKHRQGVLIKDTSTDEHWFASNNTPELHQVGSAILAPIQLPDQLIGVLIITATQQDHFDESDLAMLSIMADQAAFAIANARLFKAEQHRRRLADTLASVAPTINSTLDLNKVLDLILQQLALVIDYDSSSILLYDGDTLSARAVRGFADRADALKATFPLDENLPNYRVVIQKKPVLLADVRTERGWLKTSSSRDVRSWIGAPLIARDEVIGMLTVDSYEVNKYTEENVREVAAFADQAALAVANAQIVTLLRNVEDSYTDLFENSTDFIVITNYQGLILNANRKACQMLKRTKEALIDSDISLIDRQLSDGLVEQTKRLKAWREVSLEVEILDAYRQTIYLEIKARQVQYGGKDCVQWVGRDISARKESERTRQDLVNMLVHDLRGPLGNLINTIEILPMLVSSIADNPRVRNMLDLAKRSGQEVRDLVDSMLDIGSLEEGEAFLQRNLVELSELIQVVQDQVTPRAGYKEIELTFGPLPEIPELWIDGSMIRRVLINLLDNAIKYTPQAGKVSLTTQLVGNTLCFAVSDNGPGISKTDQAHIFEKFSRVNHADNTASGVGLGLAFCKLAAEAHGGTISIQSNGTPGEGSTFYLSIPLISKLEQ